MYGCTIGDESFIIDRHGQFVYLLKNRVYTIKKYFEYNETVTGIAIYGDCLFMATAKGMLKVFRIRRPEK